MIGKTNIQVTLANERSLIFTKVKQHSKSELIISLVANTIGWGIWLYFWKVLITAVAWSFGLQLAYEDWIILGGWEKFGSFLVKTAPYGLLLCGILWIWALQDIWRFRKETRRSDIHHPSLEKDCLWTTVDAHDLEKARAEKIVLCTHDANGELVSAVPQK
jgi:poly-beta-1,6-N-acetyl-D-glucosamine biosynthesis protein PgaD